MGIRKAAPSAVGETKPAIKVTTPGEESDHSFDGDSGASDDDEARGSDPPAKRTATGNKTARIRKALDTIATTSAAKRDATLQRQSAAPPDMRQSVATFLASLHPLLVGEPASMAAGSLQDAGVESMALLMTLSIDEVTRLLADAQLKPAQLAVLRHRLASRLSIDPAGLRAPRPGRRHSTLAGALAAMHPTLFARGSAEHASALERAGLVDAEALKSLTRIELTEVLAEVKGLTALQRAVVLCRSVDI
jgi:hypothetical protein